MQKQSLLTLGPLLVDLGPDSRRFFVSKTCLAIQPHLYGRLDGLQEVVW